MGTERFLGLLFLFLAGSLSMLGAQPYTYKGFYTGYILPTPQEVAYSAQAWPIADGRAGRHALTLIVSPKAPAVASLGAQEISQRICYLAQIKKPVPVAPALPSSGCAIVLGLASDPLVQGLLAARGITVPQRPEGYVIARFRKGAAYGLVLGGSDEAGMYFGVQSLVQLIERKNDKIWLHPATIRDWPVYRLRSFKVGGAYDPGGIPAQMARFAPFAKFNCYNICYTTLGVDKWKDPPAEYRAFVTETVRYMKARGLDCMPFVNPYYLWKTHIETSNEEDLIKLFEACRIGPQAGGTRVMLCLDDFASEWDPKGPKLYHVRSPRDRERWDDDLAAVNITMINDLARRLQQAHPEVKLYVVLPYYWNPAGYYKEEGEKYLRAVGQSVDKAVTFVWTGPQVRSAVIAKAHLDYYQGLLGGRKVMLWDNTIYMHHSPPYYLLDTFRTKYPENFWELMSGEIHLNAGGGAIYQCGLLSAADALWNPHAFRPEESLRRAIAALAGPESVDDLLAFRDTFYALYDKYRSQWGAPQSFLAAVKKMSSRPFETEELQELKALLEAEAQLAHKIAQSCRNPEIAAEIPQHVAQHNPYREALALLEKLPPQTEKTAAAANIAPNPDAEQVSGGKPVAWGLYVGAGSAVLSAASGRKGGHCGKLAATKLYDWGNGRKSINVAVMIGDSDGFSGANAPAIQPFARYYFSFWIKGNAPRVTVSFVTWNEKGSVDSRAHVPLLAQPLAAPEEWTFIFGKFVTPLTAARGCLKIGIEGYTDEGGGLGEIYVDDVYVGQSKEASLQKAP